MRQVLDLEHLGRQTMGDKAVEREVLLLFSGQARRCAEELAEADEAGRRAIAHRLQGAACSIGAFAVAAAGQALEGDPASDAYLATFRAALAEVEDFIRKLCA